MRQAGLAEDGPVPLELFSLPVDAAVVPWIGRLLARLGQSFQADDGRAAEVVGISLQQTDQPIVRAALLDADLIEAGHLATHSLPLPPTSECGCGHLSDSVQDGVDLGSHFVRTRLDDVEYRYSLVLIVSLDAPKELVKPRNGARRGSRVQESISHSGDFDSPHPLNSSRQQRREGPESRDKSHECQRHRSPRWRSHRLPAFVGAPRPHHGCHVAHEQRGTQCQHQVRDEVVAEKHRTAVGRSRQHGERGNSEHGLQFSCAMSAKSVY